MDKVVDHLLVFNGDGDIKDFPGNYSQYREWEKLEKGPKIQDSRFKIQVSGSKIQDSRFKIQDSGDAEVQKAKPRVEQKRKLSFKEKQEFAQLEQDIERLEAEKAQIESALSKRLPRLVEELDEKSMRWLELSELA